jgi:hypothetical protein
MRWGCCCTPATGCEAHPPCYGISACDSLHPVVTPGYVSIGRPIGPTKYDGPYWPAWHNSVVSTRASVDVSLKVQMRRRTVVGAACGGSCGTLPTPIKTLDCTSSTFSGVSGCRLNEYIDSFDCTISGKLMFIGASKDQTPCAYTDAEGAIHPGIPPNPFPFVLTDCTRSGANKYLATNSVSPHDWWPAENRRIAPRFSSAISVNSTAIPSNDFPTSGGACGSANHTNRCFTTSTNYTEHVCMDAPITIVPGHTTTVTSGDIARCGTNGACQCGTPTSPYDCRIDRPFNGGEEAAWCIDVDNQHLHDGIAAMGISDTVPLGDLANVWVCLTAAGKVRFMFGATGRLGSGDILRFTDDVAKTESVQVSTSSPGKSLAMQLDLTLTPRDWKTYSARCGCVQSYTENAPGTIAVTMEANVTDQSCGICGTRGSLGTYVLGIGEYQIPICAFTAVCSGATPNCMQYPVSNACAAYHPPSGPLLVDYVGSVAVERAHAGWVRYRNKYDHYLCVNSVIAGNSDPCCAGQVNMGGANQAAVCVPACTQMDQAWMHAHSCPGNVAGCNEHLTTGTNPAHCSPVTYVSGHQRLSAMPKGSACVSCDTYFQCGPMYFAGNCGTALYQVCDCCNTQITTSLAEVFVVDYQPSVWGTPVGKWGLYATTRGTLCDRSSWTYVGIASVG